MNKKKESTSTSGNAVEGAALQGLVLLPSSRVLRRVCVPHDHPPFTSPHSWYPSTTESGLCELGTIVGRSGAAKRQSRSGRARGRQDPQPPFLEAIVKRLASRRTRVAPRGHRAAANGRDHDREYAMRMAILILGEKSS